MFVADRVSPRLGLEKALESLLGLMPEDQVELLLISGPPPEASSYPVTTLGKPGGWKGRLRALPELRRIAKDRSEAGIVIVAVGTWAFATLATATSFCRLKFVLWEHTILPWRVKHEWPTTVAAVALRLFALRLEHIVCVSDGNREAVSRIVWPMKKLTVIPNITKSAKRTRCQARAKPFNSNAVSLLGIGSLTRRKNWELAIRAMQHLPDNYSLSIAGEGAQQARLTQLINSLGLGGRVNLLGFVKNAQDLIENTDVVVHPSLGETFGYTMFEAAANCRPVVVVDMPVMDDMVPTLACGEKSKPAPLEFAKAILCAATRAYDYSGVAVACEQHLSDKSIVNAWATLISGIGR